MGPTLPKDSSSMDAAVFSKMVRFESSCTDPQECFDIYRFGGCVLGVTGPATDQMYWGVVTLDDSYPTTVRWREQDPSPVPFAGHTVVVTDRDHALVLGGVSSCKDDSATYMNFLWQWSRTDGTWDQLAPIPEPCGLAFHTANYDEFIEDGMMVFGGRRGTSGSRCDSTTPRVSSTLWFFDISTKTWTERLGEN